MQELRSTEILDKEILNDAAKKAENIRKKTEDDVSQIIASVDDDVAVVIVDGAVELAVHGVILEHIGQVIRIAEVVDADDLNVRMLDGAAHDHASDAAEAVDADFDVAHSFFLRYCKIVIAQELAIVLYAFLSHLQR